jgi:lipoprotein-releasing system permease protein
VNFIFNQVMLSSESNVSGVVIKGIDPDQVGKVTELVHNMRVGRLQSLKEEEKGRPQASSSEWNWPSISASHSTMRSR